MTPPPVRILIDSRLRLRPEDLPADAYDELCAMCEYQNPSRGKLERMVRGARGAKRAAMAASLTAEPAVIRTWEQLEPGEYAGPHADWFPNGHLSLPRGALPRVRDVLRGHGLGWHYVDRRTEGDAELRPPRLAHRPNPRATDGGALRWYQEEAVEAALRKQNCLIRAPTGSGKSTTLIALIARLRLPTLVVVDSAELMRQWRERLCAELGLRDHEVGQLGGGRKVIAPITVGMRQTLLRLADSYGGTFGVVVVDEVHRAAASTFGEVVDRFASRYRVGASADETRPDGKEFLVYDMFGEVAHEVSREELIEDGAVLDVEVRIVPTEFRADWYVKQRDETGAPDFNRLLDEMTADSARNGLIFDVIGEEVEREEQTIVLSQRVEHAVRIASEVEGWGCPCKLMLGGADRAAERESTINALRARSLLVAAGTIQAVGTGIDLPSVSRGVLVTPIGNNRQLFNQIRGRICRPSPGKTAAIYVLWDQYVSGAATLRRMLEWNESVVVRAIDGTWTDGRAYLKRWKDQNDA